jgi:hypothetical protein
MIVRKYFAAHVKAETASCQRLFEIGDILVVEKFGVLLGVFAR